jgi:hypothetical protein
MKLHLWLSNPKTRVLLWRLLLTTWLCLGAFTVWTIIQWAASSSSASRTSVEITYLEAEIQEAKRLIQEGRNARSLPRMDAISAVRSFQAALQKSATERGCEVTLFQASPQITPFLSRFLKGADSVKPTNWQQIGVSAKIKGSIQKIMSTLDALRQAPIPFELDSIVFQRVGTTRANTAIVEASMELRVLSQGGAMP